MRLKVTPCVYACIAMMFLSGGMMLNAGTVGDERFAAAPRDGKRFRSDAGHRFGEMLRWVLAMKTVSWPSWIDDPPYDPPEMRVSDGVVITHVNHATMLIQLDGLNILTDPNWSDHAGPFGRIGARRIRRPGIAFDALPSIDAVLVSHDHYDHCDLPTLRRLQQRDAPLFICGLGVDRVIGRIPQARIVALGWWEETLLAESALISFVPAVHGSGRTLADRNVTLWGGFVIKGTGGSILFAGDTAWGDHFSIIRERLGAPDIVILPTGNYEPRWFMGRMHMNPADAVRAYCTLGARSGIVMHFATFAEHPEQTVDQHVYDLRAALQAAGLPERALLVPGFGESFVYRGDSHELQ